MAPSRRRLLTAGFAGLVVLATTTAIVVIRSDASNPVPSTAARVTDRTGVTVTFSGPAARPPSDLFTPRVGGNGWGNKELQSYTDRYANAHLDGFGHLVISARRETYVGADGFRRQWTSARLDTLGKWSFRTGTLTVRMKGPDAPGTWPAVWLMGDDIGTVGWPACGEIDLIELVGRDGIAHQTVHGPDAAGKPYAFSVRRGGAPSPLTDPAGFHTYSITRKPGEMTFAIDGRVSGRVTPTDLGRSRKWIFDEPMFLTINLAIGGWSGAPTARTPGSAAMVIDWIKYSAVR